MKAVIVYDSYFGNTEKIAQAIGEALKPVVEVGIYRVADVKVVQTAGVDLFIVGSPTRGFRPTPVIKDFLKGIPQNGLKGVQVAAFDTRMPTEEVKNAIYSGFVKVFGYAARPMADLLKKKGGKLCLPAEGFIVMGREGPLKEGEVERAEAWAKRILIVAPNPLP